MIGTMIDQGRVLATRTAMKGTDDKVSKRTNKAKIGTYFLPAICIGRALSRVILITTIYALKTKIKRLLLIYSAYATSRI